MLSETVEGGISRFIWLRQFEMGKNSTDMNRRYCQVVYASL
jgi:hypothetical protein